MRSGLCLLALMLSITCAEFVGAQGTTLQTGERQASGQQGQASRQQGQASGQRDQSSQYGQESSRSTQRTQVQSSQSAQVGQAGRLGTASQGNEMDTLIASCLLIGNQEEVALAQLAVDRAENPQVKQFAQMLIDDHQQAIQKLQQHAKPGIGLNTHASASSSDQSSQSPSAQQYTANRQDLDRASSGSGIADKILQMDKQAAQECLSMTKSMLEEKQGAEFDKAFAGMQVGAHVGMLAKLKASEQHASPQLASVIQESQQTVQQHLEQAKQICQQLEQSQSRQARN